MNLRASPSASAESTQGIQQATLCPALKYCCRARLLRPNSGHHRDQISISSNTIGSRWELNQEPQQCPVSIPFYWLVQPLRHRDGSVSTMQRAEYEYSYGLPGKRTRIIGTVVSPPPSKSSVRRPLIPQQEHCDLRGLRLLASIQFTSTARRRSSMTKRCSVCHWSLDRYRLTISALPSLPLPSRHTSSYLPLVYRTYIHISFHPPFPHCIAFLRDDQVEVPLAFLISTKVPQIRQHVRLVERTMHITSIACAFRTVPPLSRFERFQGDSRALS